MRNEDHHRVDEPLLLEKAIIIAKAAELACAEAELQFGTPPLDVWSHLQIHPSNCVLVGLD